MQCVLGKSLKARREGEGGESSSGRSACNNSSMRRGGEGGTSSRSIS